MRPRHPQGLPRTRARRSPRRCCGCRRRRRAHRGLARGRGTALIRGFLYPSPSPLLPFPSPPPTFPYHKYTPMPAYDKGSIASRVGGPTGCARWCADSACLGTVAPLPLPPSTSPPPPPPPLLLLPRLPLPSGVRRPWSPATRPERRLRSAPAPRVGIRRVTATTDEGGAGGTGGGDHRTGCVDHGVGS